eukprot:1196161-Prorocentrum_minimum.AAC.7
MVCYGCVTDVLQETFLNSWCVTDVLQENVLNSWCVTDVSQETFLNSWCVTDVSQENSWDVMAGVLADPPAKGKEPAPGGKNLEVLTGMAEILHKHTDRLVLHLTGKQLEPDAPEPPPVVEGEEPGPPPVYKVRANPCQCCPLVTWQWRALVPLVLPDLRYIAH